MDKKEILNQALSILHRDYPDLMGIYLFGSFAKNNQTSESDLDLAVLPKNKINHISLWNVAEAIASQISRDVDLIDLSQASTVFQAQIVNEGQRIDARDPKGCEAFEDLAFAKYVRLNDLREGIISDIQNRGTIH